VIFHLPPYFWIPGNGIFYFDRLINIHFRGRSEDNKKLLMAQEEVEHLAKVAERERIAAICMTCLGTRFR